MDLTYRRVIAQEKYRLAGINTGEGKIERSKHGAFIVYSRASLSSVTEVVHQARPEITHLEQLKTVFLLGPTPTFFGENKATTSWRRAFVTYLDTAFEFNDSFLIVLPEPFDCDWQSVAYPGLHGVEHIYAQVHWEDAFIDLAFKTGIAVLHAHFRWQGNAGPTARLEAGKLLALMKEDKVKCCVINLPNDSETVQYIEAHLLDALKYTLEGRFLLDFCSPLRLNEKCQPVKDDDGQVEESGVYANGGILDGGLLPFFKLLSQMATSLNRGYFMRPNHL